MNKWLPMWEKFGEHTSILPTPHYYFAKELSEFCMFNNLSKVVHLYDGKETIIETVVKDDNLRQRIR